MCQLLGMNCNVPTDICFSFTGFQARGGLTDDHKDGWGVAFFEEKGVRIFLDPAPSFSSPIAGLVSSYPIHSKNVIAHIRKATQGRVALENTHPFQRELWGRYWVFAHNGNLPNLPVNLGGQFRPVGDTDSEKAFCLLLEGMRKRFGDAKPACDTVFTALQELCCELGAGGPFNFLLSNGDVLFAHCSTKLSTLTRQAPFGAARLKDQDINVDFTSVTTTQDRVSIVATMPLTDNEPWVALEPGSLCMFRDGHLVKTAHTIAPLPLAHDPSA